jgi:hypothetical protein
MVLIVVIGGRMVLIGSVADSFCFLACRAKRKLVV